MFGFKSKKDKRIEELERLLYETPRIYQQNAQIETITAKQLVEPGMPIDLVKNKIGSMMLSELEDSIHFEISQDPITQYVILRGTLHYVPILQFPRK